MKITTLPALSKFKVALISCIIYSSTIMKPSTIIVSIVVILLTAWLFHLLGAPTNPEESQILILLGGSIAVVILALAFISHRNQNQNSTPVGAIITLTSIAAASYFLADHPLLWLGLAVVNIPVHILIARFFYSSKDELLFSLDNLFQGEIMSGTREESQAGMIGAIYLLSCCALVTGEYRLISFLLFPANGS